MSGSMNKVLLIGNIGSDIEIRHMQSGDKVANFSVATNERWTDKATGERKEKTEWNRVVVFNQNIIKVCENYLSKGSKVYIEGQLETRSWEQDGQKKYATEVVLRPYRGELTMLDSKGSAYSEGGPQQSYGAAPSDEDVASGPVSDFESDEIPF